jgi:hypothetical protein
LRWYADEIKALLEVARRDRTDASLCIFSDHGMTPVDSYVDMKTEVDALGFRQPDDYLVVYDATMARFWFFSEGARAGICAMLDSMFCGRRLSDEEREQLGVLFPDRRYGDVIFLLNPWRADRQQRLSSEGLSAGGDARVPSRRSAFRRGVPQRPAPPIGGLGDFGCLRLHGSGVAVSRLR